ncbi:MAG TPA: ABC transporter permease subunit [Anaerolineales bacterium]
MIADILTVAGKELREIFTFGSEGRGRGKFSLLILIGVFGVFFPLQSGREWVTSSLSIMVWGWMPFLWVSGIVADLFAGERERHTLEALLATRLSDQSILFGKLLAALTYGFSLTWLVLLSSIVTINIVHGNDGLLFYPLETTIGALVFSILVSGLSGSIGVLVSLRAGSVRQAQQAMSAGMLVLFLPFMLIQFIPKAWLEAGANLLQNVQPAQIAIGLAVFLLAIEVILIAIAKRLFQRSKLILD